ncbi:family 20 glycosylhydrolase [candidate division KSB1 bacterium]|nr:family 20 glycosylhydrolase [candidate division KSB1 bacterium]
MNRNAIYRFLFCLLVVPLYALTQPVNLMPMPQQLTWGEGTFRLTSEFTIAVEGEAAPRLYHAATRALRRLSGRTGLFFAQDFITQESKSDTSQLQIICERPATVALGEDESYSLTVDAKSILLACKSDLGGLRGLETMLQLLQSDEAGYFFPEVIIEDAPRFPWRGLLIDVCRHWLPLEVIKRNLDGMAAVKMNVFHWHLTEDQGFRIESKVFPRLHELGSDGFYFTQAQVREIIDYAGDRGIRVIPEFDMPGHATSWFVGHPELASAPGPYTIERRWGVKDPVMDPTKEYTYEFLDKFLGEMAQLFPDEYMHIGGDENNGVHWNANAGIQKYMKEHNIPDNHALQAYFNNRILNILTKYGKKMVGWDEILHDEMPTDIVIQSWRGPEFLVRSARKGYMGILSNGYYIDLIQPAEFHYLNDPVPSDSALTDVEKSRILGGEATSWAELVTPETVDSRIWPRTACIAERLWSPVEVRDVEDMYRRLDAISFQLEELGLTHIKNYDMMLRRLTGNRDIGALKVFVDVLEPVKKYQRHRQGITYTQYSPMTRVVDAARPESMTARQFNQAVARFLMDGNAKDAAIIMRWFKIWQDNHAELLSIIKASPILWEMESLSQDLADLAGTGLEATALLQAGKKAEQSWLENAKIVIAGAGKPRGQTELMVVAGVEQLIMALAEK